MNGPFALARCSGIHQSITTQFSIFTFAQGSIEALRMTLRLREDCADAKNDLRAIARTKRTLANVLSAEFGDGFAMHAPEEFEALRHAFEANGMDPSVFASSRVDSTCTTSELHRVAPRLVGDGGGEGGVSPGSPSRETREAWERKFLLEREAQRVDNERRARVEEETRRLLECLPSDS